MLRPHRGHTLWLAFALHRASGVLLALFLPAHFLMLGLALDGADSFDRALKWTETPLVKAAEVGLVFLLCVHGFGGLRLLCMEFLPWQAWQKSAAAAATAGAAGVALAFLLAAV